MEEFDLQDEIHEGICCINLLFRTIGILLSTSSTTRLDGDHQYDSENDCDQRGQKVVGHRPEPQLPRHRRVERRQAVDETGDDERDDHHLQHVHEEVSGEGQVVDLVLSEVVEEPQNVPEHEAHDDGGDQKDKEDVLRVHP